MNSKRLFSLIVAFSVQLFPLPSLSQNRITDIHPILQGYRMKVLLSDQGIMGSWIDNRYESSYIIGCQFPEESAIEHLYCLGLWVGAVIDTGQPGRPRLAKRVTQVDEPDTAGHQYLQFETFACNADTPWQHSSSFSDPTALSESDYTCEYADTTRVFLHYPLGIKVLQTSRAWTNAVRDLVLPCSLTELARCNPLPVGGQG